MAERCIHIWLICRLQNGNMKRATSNQTSEEQHKREGDRRNRREASFLRVSLSQLESPRLWKEHKENLHVALMGLWRRDAHGNTHAPYKHALCKSHWRKEGKYVFLLLRVFSAEGDILKLLMNEFVAAMPFLISAKRPRRKASSATY